jgi:hypothetical protein
LAVGAAAAILVWRRIAKRWDNPTQEKVWSALGILLGFAVPWFFVWWAEPSASPPALLYVGVGLLGAAQVLVLGSMEVIFSKQLTQHYLEVGSSSSAMFAIYGMSTSFARFLGPFVTGFVIPIVDSTGAPVCHTSTNATTGVVSLSSTCCISPAEYVVSTCVLQSINVYMPILIAISGLAGAVGLYYLVRVVDYSGGLRLLSRR